jgi:hypothetical protein
MSERESPGELHTEEDDEQPLSPLEAEYMGHTVDKKILGIDPSALLVYGEADGPETEDQYDAHHVEEEDEPD